MIDGLFFTVTLFAALGCGLMAGVFFAFSVFVMKALARLAPAEGIAVMQSINVAVINPLFLGAFLGTGVMCVVAMIVSLMHWDRPDAVYLLAGSVLYLVGTFLVTVVFNVPLNNSLAAVTPADRNSAQQWISYLDRWTAWNHVRTTAALAAAASLTIALCH